MNKLSTNFLMKFYVFCLLFLFSLTNTRSVYLRRKLWDYTPIDVTIEKHEFTKYDLNFDITLDKIYNWQNVNVILNSEDSNKQIDAQLSAVLTKNDENTKSVVQVFGKIEFSQYFISSYCDFTIYLVDENDVMYKCTAQVVRLVNEVTEQITVTPYMSSPALTYYENGFDITITQGASQAKYIKFVQLESQKSINDASGYLAISNGQIKYTNYDINTKNNIVIIIYNSDYSIIFISKELFVTDISHIVVRKTLRNIYIPYNDDQHEFEVDLYTESSTEYISALVSAKFVNKEGNATITMTQKSFQDRDKVFYIKREIKSLPKGKYYLYVNMAGKDDILIDMYILITDDIFKVFYQEVSNIHTCNYYKSNQKYLLTPIDGSKFAEVTQLKITQQGTTFSYRGGIFKKDNHYYELYEADRKLLQSKSATLNFYEYVINQNYYELPIDLTDMSFDCGEDECGFCANSHEVFGTTLTLKDVTCDATELNYTFVSKSGNVITPTCSYDATNKKLNCNWDTCVGGYYEIYVEGIKVDYFNGYCQKMECPNLYLPEHVETNKDNLVEIEFPSVNTLREVEQIRTKIKNDNVICQKYDSPKSYQNSPFYYDTASETTANTILLYIYLKNANPSIEHRINKFMLKDYYYIDMSRCEEYVLAKYYDIPCINYIVIKTTQELTINWVSTENYNKYKDTLYYRTRLPSAKRVYSNMNQLNCGSLSGLSSNCIFNSSNIENPQFLLIGYTTKFFSSQKSNLITYSTELDTCQELLPDMTLTPVIITLNPPADISNLIITASFIANQTKIINRVLNTHYTRINNKFTFYIENNSSLSAGNYSIKFEYTCPKTYTFSVAKGFTKSYDADFVLRPYIKMLNVIDGNTLYTSETTQKLSIKVKADMPEVPTLIFKNGKYTYTLDSTNGSYDTTNKILTYNVNLYVKRDELIRGTYEIYYKSICPNDPDIDTGLTVLFEYNYLTSVNKKCIYSGHINTKEYILTYHYNFEQEWRQPKNIYLLLGNSKLETTISSYKDNMVTVLIKTNINVEGDYKWAFEFIDYVTHNTDIKLYAYINKIELNNKYEKSILQTKNLTAHMILLAKKIRTDQISFIKFNYYNTTPDFLTKYNLLETSSNKQRIKINESFVFMNHVGPAVFHVEGVCGEDNDYVDEIINVLPNVTLGDAELKFTRPDPAKKGNNPVEIISELYEVREITKIKFEETDKCSYPKPTKKFVYFCIKSLFGSDDDCTDKDNVITFKPLSRTGYVHYATIQVNFKAEFQYEYRLHTIWDTNEERSFVNENVTIIPDIQYYNVTNFDKIYDELLLRDYDFSAYPYVFEFKKDMTYVTTSFDLISTEVRDIVKKEISCTVTNNECNATCTDSSVNNSTLTCNFMFKKLDNYADVSVFFKDGTCEKLLYIVKPELDECSLTTTTNSLTMKLYSQHNLGDFKILMADRLITNYDQIFDNKIPDESEFKEYDKITYATHISESTDVYLNSDLFSNDKTTYYYFKFIKGDYNHFILNDAIVKKVGVIMNQFTSSEDLITQISDNVEGKFTFNNILDIREINTLYITRENNKKCNIIMDNFTYNYTEKKYKLSNNDVSYNISLLNQIEYGVFTPYYTTAHCPKNISKGNLQITINKPEINVEISKKGENECTETSNTCCPIKMVHHIGQESSTFEFKNKYIIQSYDLPSEIIIKDLKRSLRYAYKIQENTNTDIFSFVIPDTDLINPGVYSISIKFDCEDKIIGYTDSDIFIYKNDVEFSTLNTEIVDGINYKVDYERHIIPNTFLFNNDIIEEQIKEVEEEIYECKEPSTCDSNGCPLEDECSLKSTTVLEKNKDYTIEENRLIMNNYTNTRYSKEQRVITIKDKLCKETKIGIKSKPNKPWPFVIDYSPNVCQSLENIVTIKFTCKNYDIQQINQINLHDENNEAIAIEKQDITYDTENFLVSFKISVNQMIQIDSFVEVSDNTTTISLNKIKKTIDTCIQPEENPNGYILATYTYTSSRDYFIYNQNTENINVDLKFYSKYHQTSALNNVHSSKDFNMECVANETDNTLSCKYKEEITGAKRVNFYVDDRCTNYFDIIEITIPNNTCQYYTKLLNDINFVVKFDPEIPTYENPNEEYSIITKRYHKTYFGENDTLTLIKSENNTFTYSYQFINYNYTTWANFTFYIQKQFTRNDVQFTENTILPGVHRITGDLIPLRIMNKLNLAKNDIDIFTQLKYKREPEEIQSMIIYKKNTDGSYSQLKISNDCNTGHFADYSDKEELARCTIDLKDAIGSTDYYYLTYIDACEGESEKNENIRVKLYTSANYLTSIGQEMLTINDKYTGISLIYNREFSEYTKTAPKKIELIHASSNRSSNEFGIYINMSSISYGNNKTKVNITTGSQEGLFKIKTTYEDDSVEISNVNIYVGEHALGFNKGNEQIKLDLGIVLYEVNLTFNNSVFNIEQIQSIRLKTSEDDVDSSDYDTLPLVNYKANGNNGVTVLFPNGLKIEGDNLLIINDYFYNEDLIFYINYIKSPNFTLYNNVFLISDSSKTIDINITIQLETEAEARDSVKKFYIKSCCNGNDFENLTCTLNSTNKFQIICPYKESVSMISPMNYTVQYNYYDTKLNQKLLYINPSIISNQEFSVDVQNQNIIFTHSNANLEFYIDTEKIDLYNATSCANYYSYIMRFKDVQKKCKSEGYFDLSVATKEKDAIANTYIRKFLCVSAVDIKNIQPDLYSAKPEVQTFNVTLNKTITSGFITGIIFERPSNGKRYESIKCTSTSSKSDTLKCTINLSTAVQGYYNVYFRYGNQQIEKSTLYPIKYLINYRDIISITPTTVFAYEDTIVQITFKCTFDYTLVSYLELVDSNGIPMDTKIILNNHLKNPVVYPITIPKNKFKTGYYTFKVNFVETDDTFVNTKVKLFILEKQEFAPLPQVVLRINGNVTLRIQHVKTTVEIKHIRLCNKTFDYNDGISTYQGEFTTCNSMVPEYKVEVLDYYLKMDFEFVIVNKLSDIYTISALDNCLYYNMDEYAVSLTSISQYKISLSNLSVALNDGENKYLFTVTTDANDDSYKLYKLVPNEQQRYNLLNNNNWRLIIYGESSFNVELFTTNVTFTNLTLPEYVMKGDSEVVFSNAKCKLITPFDVTFNKNDNKETITFNSASIYQTDLRLTISSKLPPFDIYGDHDLYISGCSKSLGTLFVSNTLTDSTFAISADITDLTQSIIKVNSEDFYCKIINEFTIENLGYQKNNEYITVNQEFSNNIVVTNLNQLSNPATSNLKFIKTKTGITYKHDTYNYQFEIRSITDERLTKRKFYNKILYYEGPTYVEHIQHLSSLYAIAESTQANTYIYIVIELLNSADWGQIRIDNKVTKCTSLSANDYTEYKIQKNEDKIYTKCEYQYTKVKSLEFTYQNNPCSSNSIHLVSYSFDAPECITLGREELSNEPITIILTTPELSSLLGITTKVGQNVPSKTQVYNYNGNYKFIYSYSTLYDSSNYDYQIILSSENTAITLAATDIPKMYKYVDIYSIIGTLTPLKNQKIQLLINLYSPVRTIDSPVYFILKSTSTNDYIISKEFTFDEDTQKSFMVPFNLKNGNNTEYSFSYINKCDKEVKYKKNLQPSNVNTLLSAKYDTTTSTLNLVYSKPLTESIPLKIILQDSSSNTIKEYDATKVSSTSMTATIDKLKGTFIIYSKYENNTTVKEKQTLYLNSDIQITTLSQSKQVFNDYSTNWFEIEMSDEIPDGQLHINYLKNINEDGNELEVDISEMEYVIEPTNQKIIRINTEDVVFSLPYLHYFSIYDKSSGIASTFEIQVLDGDVTFTFDKHFYLYEAAKEGIKFSATGVSNVYNKSPKKEYYTELTNVGGNHYIFVPSNLEEIILLYYSQNQGETKYAVSEKLYVYQDITTLIKFNKDTCVYSSTYEYDFNIKINSNIQKTFLKFKINDQDLTESNSVYTYKNGHTADFKILDSNQELYSSTITFTNLDILSDPELNDNKISFKIFATCNIPSLTIKANNIEYPLTCTTNNCELTIPSGITFNTFYLMNGDTQIGIYKVYNSIDKATFTMKSPTLIVSGTTVNIVLSSDDFKLSDIQSVTFKHKNGLKETIDNLTIENGDLVIPIKLIDDSDTMELIELSDKSSNTVSYTNKYIIQCEEFDIITDEYLSLKYKNITIKLNGNKEESIIINGAFTDKGLQFKGNTCKINDNCVLELITKDDYSSVIGKNTLTITYDSTYNKTMEYSIIVREDEPYLESINLYDSSKTFKVIYSQNIYSEYLTTDDVYIAINTQTEEFKCTGNADGTQEVIYTCPISYFEGIEINSYIFDKKTEHQLSTKNCGNNLVNYKNECVYCKEKDANTPLYYNSKCYSKCPTDTYEYENVCISECPEGLSIQNGKCVKKCGDGYGLGSELQSECYLCSSKGQKLNDGYCVKDCASGLKYDEEKQQCTMTIKVNVTEVEKYSGYCSNDGVPYIENNILKCNCTGKYVGSRCDFTTDDVSTEGKKLKDSIFAFGTIGKDGKIQTTVTIDYDSNELMSILANLIDLTRTNAISLSEEDLVNLTNQINNDIDKLVQEQINETLTELSKENFIGVVTFAFEISLINKRRRLSDSTTIDENQKKLIEVLKKFYRNIIKINDTEAKIDYNSFDLFGIKSYKNNNDSKNALLNKMEVNKNTAKLAYVSLNNCSEQIPNDTTISILETKDNKVSLNALDGLSVNNVNDSVIKTCIPTYTYKTNCDSSNEGNSKSNYITEKYEGKGIDFTNSNDPFFTEKCYITPDSFPFDFTYKSRMNDFSQPEINIPKQCKPNELKCGSTLEITCNASDNLTNTIIIINNNQQNVQDQNVNNLVTKCSKNIENLGSNAGFIINLIFFLFLIIGFISFIIVECLNKFSESDVRALQNDGFNYLNVNTRTGNYAAGQNVEMGNINEKNNENNNPQKENITRRQFNPDINRARSFITVFLNNLMKLHPLTKFFIPSLIYPLLLKIIFTISQILITLGFNAILFFNSYIYNRIYDNNRNSFGYPMKNEFGRIILSILITALITFVCKFVCIVTGQTIRDLNDTCESKDTFTKFKKHMLPRRIAAVLILLALDAFSFWYTTAFCYIYHKTVKGLIYGAIWSFLFVLIIFAPIYIAIISIIEIKNVNVALNMKKLFIF